MEEGRSHHLLKSRIPPLIIDRVSRERNAIDNVHPSVRPSNRLFALYLLNRLSFEP